MDQQSPQKNDVIPVPYDKRLIAILSGICILSSAVTGFAIYKLQDDSKFSAVKNTETSYQDNVDDLTEQVTSLQTEVNRLHVLLETQDMDNQDTSDDTQGQEGTFLAPASYNFFENGNFLNGKTLLYEEPGQPALSVILKFTESSICIDGLSTCKPASLTHGQNVFVAGKKSGSTVTVAVMVTK